MRKIIAGILCCAVLLGGCAAPSQPVVQPTAVPTPPPTPVPTPPPLRVLCIADSLQEDVPEYFAAVEEHAAAHHWELTYAHSIDGFEDAAGLEGYEGILALRTQQRNPLYALEVAAGAGVPVAIVDVYKSDRPAKTSYAYYEEGDLLALVLNTALTYPPHDTPVRMFGVFSGRDTAPAQAYAQAIAEGKILDRASYYVNEEQSLAAFLEKQLERYAEGMVDAIFVEDIALGMEVLRLLKQHAREDMEVFAVPNRNVQEQRELYHKYVFPAVVGPDLAEQAALQVEELARLLEGLGPQEWKYPAKVSLHGVFQK